MFSQTAEYALRAMACLALHADDRVSSAMLAETTQVPQDYLAKVLQLLAKASLIEGRRGVGGGYQIARGPDEIRLIEVVEAVEPLKRIETCPLNIKSHGPNLCPLHRKMDDAAKAVIEIFDDTTLADVLTSGASTPLCDNSGDGRATLTVDRR